MELIQDDRWADLLETRATRPEAIATAFRARERRPRLTDGRLLLVAADHTARGMLAVRDQPLAMADRRQLLERLSVALAHPGVDGVLGSPDVIEELALLGALESKLVVGTMNRGGLQGSIWELDDPMTAYDAPSLARCGMDAGKMLLRIDVSDPGTRDTITACSRAVGELAAHDLMAMIEPLPYTRDGDGKAVLLDDGPALIRAVAVASALGTTSAGTWLKVPSGAHTEAALAASTLPALILGGSPGPEPEKDFEAWSRAMELPTVRGLVVGRALLYPPDGDVAAAIERAALIVRPEGGWNNA
jgi:hypothetical protein